MLIRCLYNQQEDNMSDIAYDIIKESLPSLTEHEALTVFCDLQAQFGWSGTVFTRVDAEQEWQNTSYGYGGSDEKMPDTVWDAVQESWYWRKGLPENMCERGWTYVTQAVLEALEGDE